MTDLHNSHSSIESNRIGMAQINQHDKIVTVAEKLQTSSMIAEQVLRKLDWHVGAVIRAWRKNDNNIAQYVDLVTVERTCDPRVLLTPACDRTQAAGGAQGHACLGHRLVPGHEFDRLEALHHL